MPIYEKPTIVTLDAARIIEAMGPAQGYVAGQSVSVAMPEIGGSTFDLDQR